MILSASYRTDIPAFYGEWFMQRLISGRVAWRNPYGGGLHHLDLLPEVVEAFVFWTRNPAPFFPVLEWLARRDWPFVIQITITGYPRPLEASVPPAEKIVTTLRSITDSFGPGRLVWRYDPVFLSDLTTSAFHREQVTRLADMLEGLVDEAVLSFAQIYAKTRRNSDHAGKRYGFAWHDPSAEEKRQLLAELAALLKARNIRPSLCSQPELLSEELAPARCIDAKRLSALAGRPILARTKGNREGCLCAESRDIGRYDSCPHGCVYCYAVTSSARAKARYRAHDPRAEAL